MAQNRTDSQVTACVILLMQIENIMSFHKQFSALWVKKTKGGGGGGGGGSFTLNKSYTVEIEIPISQSTIYMVLQQHKAAQQIAFCFYH